MNNQVSYWSKIELIILQCNHIIASTDPNLYLATCPICSNLIVHATRVSISGISNVHNLANTYLTPLPQSVVGTPPIQQSTTPQPIPRRISTSYESAQVIPPAITSTPLRQPTPRQSGRQLFVQPQEHNQTRHYRQHQRRQQPHDQQ